MSADSSLVEPESNRLRDVAEARITHLLSLTENWDSYGGDPLDSAVADRARLLLGVLRSEPFIAITGNGGIHLSWGADEDVIICLEPDGAVSALIEDTDLVALPPAREITNGHES